HGPAGVDVAAGRALPAWIGRGALLAVERLGEDPRDGGLAHPARAGEQERVVDASAVQGIGQRTHHMLLPDQLGEASRAPLAGEDEIGHRYLRVPASAGATARRDGIVPCLQPAAGARTTCPLPLRKLESATPLPAVCAGTVGPERCPSG